MVLNFLPEFLPFFNYSCNVFYPYNMNKNDYHIFFVCFKSQRITHSILCFFFEKLLFFFNSVSLFVYVRCTGQLFAHKLRSTLISRLQRQLVRNKMLFSPSWPTACNTIGSPRCHVGAITATSVGAAGL